MIVARVKGAEYAAATCLRARNAVASLSRGQPNVPFGWIDFPPSINRLIGLRWLARILYPDAFPEDLRPIVRDFYTRCYHQTPSEAQLDVLLRPAA